MSSSTNQDHRKKEAIGWLTLMGTIVLFPTLYFVIVWIPMWMGWAP